VKATNPRIKPSLFNNQAFTAGLILGLALKLTVLSDLCADRDPEVHRLLTERIFRHQAWVISAAAWREATSAD